MSMKRRAELANVPFTPIKVRRAGTGPNVDVATSRAISRTVKKEIAKNADYKQARGRWSPSLGIDANGLVFGLSSVLSRGDNGVNQFEGTHIEPKSLKIRWRLENTTADTFNMIRIMVVQWFDDAIPTNAGFVLDGSDLGTIHAPLSARLWTNRPNYKILFDHVEYLNNTANSPGSEGPHKYVETYIPKNKLKRIYFNTSSTRAQRGEIYLVAISDSTAIGHPGVSGTFDMIFTD